MSSKRAGPPPAADALYVAICMADRLLRVAHAERQAAESELDEVLRAAQETIAWASEYATDVSTRAATAAAEWRDQVEPALAAALGALRDADVDDALKTLNRLNELFGGATQFRTTEEFVHLETLELGRLSPVRSRVPATVLGEAGDPPVSAAVGSALTALVSERHARWLRPHAGVHLAVRRTAYTHHGIYLGDGSIIEFGGDPPRKGAVRRVPLRQFLRGRDPEPLRQCRPHGVLGVDLSVLDPAVVSIRALAEVGATGYDLLNNNCEHFAAWSQLGVRLSTQVDVARSAAASAAELRSKRTRKATEEAGLRALGMKLRMQRTKAPTSLLLDTFDELLPVDAGRAYWARDRGELVTWVPMWEDRGQPLGGPDRPWTLGLPSAGSSWQRSAPTVEIDPEWHASLLALADGRAYWITSTGQWSKAEINLREIYERRLENAERIFRELLAGPSVPARALLKGVDAADAAVSSEQERQARHRSQRGRTRTKIADESRARNSPRFTLQFDAGDVRSLAADYEYRDEKPVRQAAESAARRGWFTKSEFLEVAEWKTGGRQRANYSRNTAEEIKRATRAMLASSDSRERLRSMENLRGVGLPTASTFMHFTSDRDPILDRRALQALGIDPPPRSYSPDFYAAYAEACREIADEAGVDMRTLDRALWWWSRQRGAPLR